MVANGSTTTKTKREYRCELIDFVSVGHAKAAIIRRLEDHEKLGAPIEGKATITSAVIDHDVANGIIETRNSIYRYK